MFKVLKVRGRFKAIYLSAVSVVSLGSIPHSVRIFSAFNILDMDRQWRYLSFMVAEIETLLKFARQNKVFVPPKVNQLTKQGLPTF